MILTSIRLRTSLPFTILLAAGIPACSSDSSSTPAAAIDAGNTSQDSSVAADANAAADTGGGGVDAPSAANCTPKASCMASHTCLGLADNAGKTKFGLRMGEIDFTAPAALTTGIIQATFAGSAGQQLPSCNENGTGTFSWLLQFDTAAGTLKTGGAKPVADPTTGYSFDDEMIVQGSKSFHVQPATYMTRPDGTGAYATTMGLDMVMPIFLNATGSMVVLLPLHQVTMLGMLSTDQDCVGTYNAAGLDPGNSCQADRTHPAFLTGGTASAYITLEEADTVDVSAISQTLCVVLSGNASMYGDGANPSACKRDASMKILFQGDWCAGTNAPAAAGCSDSVSLKFAYAASAITVNN